MPRDPEAFADMVVLTVRAALAPLLERVAAAEQANKELRERVGELAGLRDRLTAVETKAAHTPEPSTAEAELALRDKLEPVTKSLAAMSERLAVLEVRAPVPGPAGQDGKPGQDGKDGIDGLGFDDLNVEFDGDRTVLLKFARGTQTKSWPIVLPFMRQQGVYIDGKSYGPGDVVTWAGSQWHCNEDTVTKPGDGSKAWTLIVKRGRDGKDGRDGHDLVPVVRTQ